MSAGAAHELAGACRTGAVVNCICETIGDVRTQDAQGNIIFNECSDNIKFASDIVRQLTRENSTNITDVDLVNNHNYEVGLRVRLHGRINQGIVMYLGLTCVDLFILPLLPP